MVTNNDITKNGVTQGCIHKGIINGTHKIINVRLSQGCPREYKDHYQDNHRTGENWMMEDFLWSQIQPRRKRQVFDMLSETRSRSQHRY